MLETAPVLAERDYLATHDNSAPEASELVSQIAHELRQPLSTIEAIAYYLDMVLPRTEQKARQQLAKLQQLVEQSNWIVTNAVHLTNPLVPAPQKLDLEESITRVAAEWVLTAENPVQFDFRGELPLVYLDPGQAHDLLQNLFTFFRQIATPDYPMVVRTSTTHEGVLVEFSSDAPGYSTNGDGEFPSGSGLSLASVRRHVEANGGRFEATANAEDGVNLRVAFPVDET